MNICSHCGTAKAASEFYTNGSRMRSACKHCTRVRQKATRYGMTLDSLESLYAKQNFECAICSRKFDLLDLHVDHDHLCCKKEHGGACGNCVRGLLCPGCNHAVGYMEDDADRMLNAATYLMSKQRLHDYHTG